MSKTDQKRAMEQSLARLEKKYGAGVAVQMGSKKIEPIDVFHSGSYALDLAIGDQGVNCGLPWGRIVELYGPESAGKTTLALTFVAQVQKLKKLAAYVDAEHCLDLQYAAKLGVNVKELVICQPDYGEQGLEVASELIQSGAVSIVVVDSVAALVPRAELEGEMGDAFMGLQARLMGQALRKLASVASNQKVTVVFLNQLRQKIGVMFGNPETTTGGKALKFWASLRLDVRREATLKDGEKVVGSRTKVKVVKNKIAKPFKEAHFDLIFGEGISTAGELIDLGVECGAIVKAGSWHEMGENRLGQGREAAKRHVMENQAVFEALRDAVMGGQAKVQDALEEVGRDG